MTNRFLARWRPAPAAGLRPWTDEELQMAAEMLHEGWPTAKVARKLGRTVTALLQALSVAGIGVRELRSDPYASVRAAYAVALLFGADPVTVRRWTRLGWLKAQHDRRIPHSLWLITDDALMTFIETRDYWPYWAPERMTDADWRATAEEARRRAGGHWLRGVEVQQRFNICATTMLDWLRDGRFPAGSYVYHSKPLGYFFWSADIDLLARTLKKRTP